MKQFLKKCKVKLQSIVAGGPLPMMILVPSFLTLSILVQDGVLVNGPLSFGLFLVVGIVVFTVMTLIVTAVATGREMLL